MLKMKINSICWFLLLVFAGCAVPKPVVKLTPSTLKTKDYWSLGQQFVFNSDKNVWFDCAYNRTEGESIIFDVKINNLSDTAVLISPALFYQRVYSNDSLQIAQNYAADPEMVLTFLKLDENVANANATNASTFSIWSSLISTGAVVAVAVSKKDEKKKERLMNIISASNDLAQASAGEVRESSNIRAENNWTKGRTLSESFLRKTTLPKGFFLEGEVHFPFHGKAKWYEITLLAGESKVSFLFKQNLIYPQVSTNQ
jgi:hypothetical protein